MSKREIVDAHHHLWALSAGYNYPWLQDEQSGEGMLGDLKPIIRDYLLPELVADAGDYALVKSVHIEAVPKVPLTETRWLQGLTDKTGLPTAIVGYADLTAPDLEAHLAAQAAFPSVRGVRQIVNWHPNPKLTFSPKDLLLDEQWRKGFALLKKYDLSFDLQLYPNQMQSAAEIARANPETLLIVNHTGMPADGYESWRAGMAALAACPNIVCKVSGLGMLDHKWTAASIRPYVLGAIELFGTGRVMFGSNFPVDKLYSSFKTLYGAFESIVAGFSADEQDRLFRANAIAHYRL